MTEKQNHRIGIGLLVTYTVIAFGVSLARNVTMADGIFQGFDIENTMYDFWAQFMPTWFVITIYLFGNTEKDETKKSNQAVEKWTMLDAIAWFLAIGLAIVWVVIGLGGLLRLFGLI